MNTVNYNDAEQLFGAVGTSLKKHTAEIADIVNVYGAKNLLPYPYESTTRITNGITYTDNGDGTIKINGTCVNASAWFYIRPQGLLKDVTDIKTPGTYIFSRGTDALDTLQYYRIYDITVGADLIGADRGDLTFTVTEEQLTHTVTVGCWIKVGKTVNNIVMKPMIRLASIEDDTYEPYSMTNQQLTGLYDNEVEMGAVNLLPCTIKSHVRSGVTLTVNPDGSVKLNGTASGNNIFPIADSNLKLKKGTYKFTCLGAQGSDITFRAWVNNLGDSVNHLDYGNGVIFTINSDVTTGYIGIGFSSGQVFNNQEFRPMITLASQPNSDYAHYVPYAKSNKELTDDIASLAARIKAIEDTNHLTWG
jgi:hypothetical protein